MKGKKMIYQEVNEDLIAYVNENTKSVRIMDTFEGIEGGRKYKRIIVKNSKYRHQLNLNNGASVNLVIERSSFRQYKGDITFTDFKNGKDQDLIDYIKREITNEIADRYLNKDRFFRFSKPYRLRAQNSRNRTGYGDRWEWHGGEGECVKEGTKYGETTDYVFVGAYITTHIGGYESRRREPFE